MYERNAIVIDRFFSSIFGYDQKNNLKVNEINYFELVEILEKYQEASQVEDKVMIEFEKIANKIKETQRKQKNLENKTLKYFEKRKNLFENLDENDEELKREFERTEKEFYKNEEEIKENTKDFIEEIKEFNEKSEIRNKCGRERRIIENDYQKILDVTLENFNNILKEKLKEIKSFIKTEDKEEIKEQMKVNILKNGSKEKVPFDSNVINKAIDTSLYIEEKKGEILLSIYDKTSKLIQEIKNDTIKIDKHKKQVKDSRSKLEFLNVITDYIILFLDNERMNTIGGEVEHRKIMNEACENLQKDLIEIQNMYSLLIKEINGKSTKKLYKELYNIDYLNALKEQEYRFEKNISRLNMTGSVIYPDYWRIEGMQKIYDTFRTIMTDIYEVDLSEFEPLDITFEVNKEILSTEQENSENKDEEEIIENDNLNEEIVENEEKDIISEITQKYNITNNKDDEEEFHWDEEDEEDELIFDKNNEYQENEEENEDDEENDETEIKFPKEADEEEDERDKEIDELLGIFDTEDTEENDDDIEDHILQIEEDDEELDDDIFEDENINQENKKEVKQKNKRKTLFGRRK